MELFQFEIVKTSGNSIHFNLKLDQLFVNLRYIAGKRAISLLSTFLYQTLPRLEVEGVSRGNREVLFAVQTPVLEERCQYRRQPSRTRGGAPRDARPNVAPKLPREKHRVHDPPKPAAAAAVRRSRPQLFAQGGQPRRPTGLAIARGPRHAQRLAITRPRQTPSCKRGVVGIWQFAMRQVTVKSQELSVSLVQLAMLISQSKWV